MKSLGTKPATESIAVGTCFLCMSLSAGAHGNLGIPFWGPAVLWYLLCFTLLFLAAICAATDDGAARWLRITVPLAMAVALAISSVTARDNHSIRDQFFEAFAALCLPAIFAVLWLLGAITRWRRGR